MFQRTITITPATTMPDYQILINLNTSNFDYTKARTDGGDIRFYDNANNLLSYYIEAWNPNGNSIIWVKIPSTGTSNIRMDYGDVNLTSISNPHTTFLMFDHFDDNVLDLTKWTSGGFVSQTSSIITIGTPTSTIASNINSVNSYSNVSLRFYGKLIRVSGNTAFGGLYKWQTDVQIDYRMTSATTHVARVRENGIVTDINVLDYNNINTVYELSFLQGSQAEFYINDQYVGTVSNNISNPVPVNTLPIRFHSNTGGAQVVIDWIHVRHYDGSVHNINVGSESETSKSVLCTTIPSGASVEIDGFLQTGVTPITYTNISIAPHNIIFRLNNYKQCEIFVPDISTEASCTLKAVSTSNQISITPATTMPDYQILINLNTSNFDYTKARTDGGDIRFYDNLNNLLSYYIESWNYIGNSIIWVKIPSTGTSNIRMDYGDVNLTSISNPHTTFLMFDHFDDNVLDTSKWSIYGTYLESGTEIMLEGSLTNAPRLASLTKYGTSVIRYFAKMRYSDKGDSSTTGYYDRTTDAQAGFRMTSLLNHVARIRNTAIAPTIPIVTDIQIQDTTDGYYIYDIEYMSGNHVNFYLNDIIVASVVNNTFTPIPIINIPFACSTTLMSSTATIRPHVILDWIHIRNYDGLERIISIEGTICVPLTCTLNVV